MKTIIATILAIHLAVISSAPTSSKCQKMANNNEEPESYSCDRATLDDTNVIPYEAKWLQFTVSKLSHLPEKAFTTFALHGLSFYNCEIGKIHPNAFDGLEELQQLTFYGSNIHVLKASWFKDLSSLTHLFLDQNDMVYIEPTVFSLIPKLEYLNIEDNNLNCLSKNTLEPLKQLKYIRINENPWLCSCYAELVKWIKSQQINHGERNGGIECMVDYDTRLDDYEAELSIKIQEDCLRSNSDYFLMSPKGSIMCVGNKMSIRSEVPNNARSIKLLNSNIPKIQQLAFFQLGNSLKRLEFSNCSIREIHPEAFAGLSKLEQLILFNNSINIVRAEWFRDLHSLKYLALDSNGIENIQSQVFPLLNRLESLSLRKNDMGCFPLRAFTSMKNLRYMNIANNNWICRCLEDFRNWVNQSSIDIVLFPTQCTDEKMHMNDREYISGYRNSTFQQNFEDEEAKIMSENAELILQSTIQDTETGNDISIAQAPIGDENVKIIPKEEDHERMKKIANYEYHFLRTNDNHQNHANVLRAKYDGFERIPVPDVTAERMHFNIESDRITQSAINSPAESSSTELSPFGRKKSYVFVGLTLWDILISPTDAEEVKFERSPIPEVMPSILSRFHNLRSLKYVNCGVQEILPYAFAGLTKLQELVLDDNEIRVVRSVWFKDIPNLERLSLMGNLITRIEKNVFQLLPNLKYLGISNNRLNSIEIDGLSYMKNLNLMNIGKHPCSCTCQIELHEWLVVHKVSYDNDFELEFNKIRNGLNCVEEYKSFKMYDKAYQIENSVDMEESDEHSSEANVITVQEKYDSEDANQNQATEEVRDNSSIQQSDLNTIFDVTMTAVEQTTPTSTTITVPDHSKGRCKFEQVNILTTESRWWCSGGDLSIFDQIQSSAERIDLVDSHIPIIPANTFTRFSNLTKLFLFNNSIHDIDLLAFATLQKLEWLIFLNNNLPIIKSSWFYDLQSITLLGLARNSVTEIEPDVFNFLPNLKRLSIQENNLRCIYTKSLSYLKDLESVRMQDNPWKWRCQEEMTQFFEAHNISYVKSEIYDGLRVISDL